MTDVEAGTRGSLGTVRNAVALLHLLAEGPAHHQLTDLAERSGLSLPTVHRLLRSLSLAGLVEQDSRSARYGLGPELVRLSQRYLGRLPVLAAISPYLMPVRDVLGVSVHVVLHTRGWATYVDRAEGTDGSLYREPHRVAPALRTAPGRLLAARSDDASWELALAQVTDEERAEAIAGRPSWQHAPHLALPDPDGGAVEVAVPILDLTGEASAALVASVTDDDGVRKAVTHLSRAAQAAGRTLGHG
ncbi:IclR family transcriptional regulator [Micromonospora sp. DT47]|uniref:IclR family transcriptional regulator n=1 Tax=Micromonospora sp. DT47 TaxID=3393431 RepID=UPI003CED6B76